MLNSGDVFAGFTVERLLGQGGMGSVYLARHPRLGKLTALKLLNRELYADREIRARFEREADLVARLDHPNIVEVYDRGTENEMLWISMQYVDGVDAASVNVATLPPERAVQVIEGVASALDYAHGMGVLHRDVKPANIILARAVAGHGERVFLTDFGIARLREDSTHLTQAGMFTATLAYASPEQMTGAHLDPTTDQYSLACALYWLLIGAGPYDSPHPAELIRGHLQLLPPPVSLRRPGLSPAMDAVLTKAMAKRPADRFPSCTAFAKAARQALSGPPSQHPALQHPARPAYPNPPAPQPNYAAAQPYPAPGYQAPPQPYPAAPPQQPPAYPAPPQQPPAYPAPPQPSASPVPPSVPPAQQPIPAPNYPAPQQPSGLPGSQQPAGAAPGYPAAQQPAGPVPGYPAPPQPGGWTPQSQQDTERVNSGPTVRPYPPGQEAAPANYPAPQPAPPRSAQDSERPDSGPTARPHPLSAESARADYSAPQQAGTPSSPQPGGSSGSQPGGSSGAQPGGSAWPQPGSEPDRIGSGPTYRPESTPPSDDPSQRPTDIVPQPVVSTGRQADSAARTETLAHPSGVEAASAAASAAGATGAASRHAEHGAEGPGTDASDLSGSPGFAELAAEPLTALAQSAGIGVPPGEASPGSVGAESNTAVATRAADAAKADEMWASAPIRAGRGSEPIAADPAEAPDATDFVGAEDESGAAARHPHSGAFVPASPPAGASGVPDASGTAATTGGSTESAAPEQVSGVEAGASTSDSAPGVPGSAQDSAVGSAAGTPIPADPGYGVYGAVPPGGPVYGAPSGAFGPNAVRPGLIPTSQRAEASQVTALLVLGLALVALVLMIVVAVVLVSG